MSYEGYKQCICTNGHYYQRDCWDDNDPCGHCQASAAWVNPVDETNGSSEGWILLKVLEEKFLLSRKETRTCNLNCLHVIKEAVFRIPTRKETDPLRHCSSAERSL